MRHGIIAESIVERIGLASGLLPTPMLEPYGMAFARALMAATELGVFEVLADGALPATAIAERCGTDRRATAKLLDLLVGMRYLRRASDGTYALSRMSRRWLVGQGSARDTVLMKYAEWRWMEGLEQFLRTGEPLDVHETLDADGWRRYQRGMRAQAGLAASALARRLPMPVGASTMLDVGGSHGYFSVALCRRHPGLSAVVLDLPEAVAEAAPLLAAEGMGDRVVHRSGNALTDDLGTEAYDLVLAFSLVHHFDADTNRAFAARCARALRPGGRFVIGDLERPRATGRTNTMDRFYDLYFALTSRSGLWSPAEMAGWQRAAGLVPRKPLRLFPGLSLVLQIAEKPAG